MSVKKAKAKGQGKGTAKKRAKPRTRTKKGKDIVQVRENINELVKASAKAIANKVIEVAKTGQLASAKYLFEAVGLYPATEQTTPAPEKGSLAHTLLMRMGLPTEPVIRDEDEAEFGLANEVKDVNAETTEPSVENEPGAEREGELEPELDSGDGTH